MVRRITAAALILLVACGGRTRMSQDSGKALTYAQYSSLERGVRADAILKAFGPASDVREGNGQVRGLAYPCEDASGRVLELRMVFTPEGTLAEWVLRDPKSPASAPEPRPRP